jgi:membrane carboxypeptidase/penicillin-binding protein
VSVAIDPQSGQIATAACPKVRTEYFIEGTQPVETCQLHGGGGTQIAGWDTSTPRPAGQPAGAQVVNTGQQRVAQSSPPAASDAGQQPAEKPKKKGFFERLKGIFR